MYFRCPDYKYDIFNPPELKKTVARVSKNIKRLRRSLEFDAIAFTGSSGAAIAYPVSVATGIELIFVRKGRESSHGYGIEGRGYFSRYVILDDFISDGNTVRRVRRKLDKLGAECVGIVLYNDDRHGGGGKYRLTNKILVPVYNV